MYEFIEEPTKEEGDLIYSVYKAIRLKPSLFIHFMNACYGAFNKRVEFAEKRAADAEIVCLVIGGVAMVASVSITIKDALFPRR